MEDLVFLLKLNQHLIYELESGRSLFSSMQTFQKSPGINRAYYDFQKWMESYKNESLDYPESLFLNELVENYFFVIEDGLRGSAILDQLKVFHTEVNYKIELQIKKEVNKLPYLLMIPLMLFILPSFLILILGPIFSDILNFV